MNANNDRIASRVAGRARRAEERATHMAARAERLRLRPGKRKTTNPLQGPALYVPSHAHVTPREAQIAYLQDRIVRMRDHALGRAKFYTEAARRWRHDEPRRLRALYLAARAERRAKEHVEACTRELRDYIEANPVALPPAASLLTFRF